MGTLSTTAWVLHDLGLAAGFGGNLFGQLALNPALRAIQSTPQRATVSRVARDRYNIINVAALTAMAGTWLLGRFASSGWEVGQRSRKMTLLKDGLVAGATVTGIGAAVTGFMLDATLRSGHAVGIGGQPTADRPRLQRIAKVFGTANLMLQASVLAVTAVLAMQAGKSRKWTLVSRVFS